MSDLKDFFPGGGSGGGGGLEWQVERTIDFTAEDGKGYPMSNGITMTLPPAPTDNMQIGWKDFNNEFGDTPCFIDPGANAVEQFEAGEVVELNTKGQGGVLVWMTDRWIITDVTDMSTAFQAAYGVKSVQHILASNPGNGTTIAIPTPVDPDNSYIVVNGSSNLYSGPGYLGARLTDGSTITFYKSGSGQCNVHIYVVELQPGTAKSIQHLDVTVAGQDLPIEEVDLTKSFLIFNGFSEGSAASRGVTAYIQDSTIVRVDAQPGGAGSIVAGAIVVELADQMVQYVSTPVVVKSIQRVTISHTGGGVAYTETINAVDLSKTHLRCNIDTNARHEIYLEDATTLKANINNNVAYTYTIEVVEYETGVEVQRFRPSHPGNDTTIDQVITAVDPAQASINKNFSSLYRANIWLEDGTTVKIQASDTVAQNCAFEVIEYTGG